MRVAGLCVVLLACGSADRGDTPPTTAPAAADPAPAARRAPPSAACRLALSSDGGMRLNDTRLADLAPATVAAILGAPDRVETTETRERYEEHGHGDVEPTSTMVPVTHRHVVHDDRSLVLEQRSSAPTGAAEPDLRIFFPPERRFAHTERPAVAPRARGACAVTIDGHRLDPSADLVPDGTDPVRGEVALGGASFSVTSFAGVVDRIYLDTPGYRVSVFLDEPATQRAAYVELRRRRP